MAKVNTVVVEKLNDINGDDGVVVPEKVDDGGNDIEVERSTIGTNLHLPQVPPSLLRHAPRQLRNTAAKQWSKVKSREIWGIGFASWRGIGK